MQFPITIGLHRSFLLLAATLVVHGLAALALLLPPWPWPPLVPALAALGASAVWVCMVARPKVSCLRLLADGRLQCQVEAGETFVDARILPGATVHPWLTVVRLELAGRKAAIVVLPDSTTGKDFRRLRVWLRWRAEFSGERAG